MSGAPLLTRVEFERTWQPNLVRCVQEAEPHFYHRYSDALRRVYERFDFDEMWKRYLVGECGEGPPS